MEIMEERPARIRLSVLEPPCRCREPLVDAAVRDREEIVVDVRRLDGESAIVAVRKGIDRLTEAQRLRVLSRSASPAMLAAIQTVGERFQITGRSTDGVELLVWRFYSVNERRRYLHQAVDGR